MEHKLLDTVVLAHDLPERGLRAGDLGAVVEVYEPDGLEVEFVTASGLTEALVTLKASEVRQVGAGRVASRRRRRNMELTFTAVYRKVPEGYAAVVEELPGANTQGATLEEARENLREAVALVLEANRSLAEEQLGGAEVIRETLKLSA